MSDDTFPWAIGERMPVARWQSPDGKSWAELYAQRFNERASYGFAAATGPGSLGFITEEQAISEMQARAEQGNFGSGALVRVEPARGGAR